MAKLTRRRARAGPLAALVLVACHPARRPDVIFLPSAADVVERMLAIARVGPDDVVYDLGCGDGRIVIAAARLGARGVCVDIDPSRIAASRHHADTAGVTAQLRFIAGDLFEVDLGEATVVTLYLSPALNRRLRPKLFRELRPGTRIVSHNFDMGDWPADSVLRVEWPTGTTSTVLLWLRPADVAGTWELVADPPVARRYRLRFEQRYQHVAGTASLHGRSVALTNARVDGAWLEFTLTDTLAGRSTALHFRGRGIGAEAAGTFTGGADTTDVSIGGRRATGRWRAVRPGGGPGEEQSGANRLP